MHPLKLKNLLHRHHHQAIPTDLVHRIHDHLLIFHNSKNNKDLNHRRIAKLLEQLHCIVYGDSDSEPNPKVCSKTAEEFFKNKHSSNNPFRVLIKCFGELEWESQTLACQIVTNLMAQHLPCSSNFIAADYFEENMDLVDFLLTATFDLVDRNCHVALLYGSMLRECVLRSQTATKHVLHSRNRIKKFLDCATLPNYTFAAHVADTLDILLTRHKSCVAEFLSTNYEWFFEHFNSKLLMSSNQLTKSKVLTLLGNLFLEGKNRGVMLHYLSDVDNLKVVMNALRESKSVQLKAFHVFKLFVLNSEKPQGVVDILRLNKPKLLQFLDGLKPCREDHKFDEDKSRVITEISVLHHQVLCNHTSLPEKVCNRLTINVA
ncbi:hypothetical protein VNO77_07853 [Canavalia gladiata]|uniref:Uncharacterized protein n=1 Tax=Canavalia gladiata TaxID=3824 RepID=A0AAN9QTK5_CANGL